MNVTTFNPFALYARNDAQRFPCAYPEGEVGRPSTLFWADFSVAEAFGLSAVKDTYRRIGNIKELPPEVLVELIVVLNHKLWQLHDTGAQFTPLYECYEKWYNICNKHAQSTNNGWTRAQRDHYFYVTD